MLIFRSRLLNLIKSTFYILLYTPYVVAFHFERTKICFLLIFANLSGLSLVPLLSTLKVFNYYYYYYLIAYFFYISNVVPLPSFPRSRRSLCSTNFPGTQRSAWD